MDADVSVELDGDDRYAIKIATDIAELNIRVAPHEVPLLKHVQKRRWEDGTLRIGESAGAPVHWCSSESGGVAIMIGHDDQTSDISFEISTKTFDAVLRQLSVLSSEAQKRHS